MSEADIDTILQQAHDLTAIERNMEVSELEKLFMTTFLGANPDTTAKVAPISAPTSVVGMDPIPSLLEKNQSRLRQLVLLNRLNQLKLT